MKNIDQNMQDCIQACWQSRNECQKTLFNHCLQMGDDHLDPQHVKLMIDCMQICQLAADAMVRQSPLSANICGLCATACTACAESCELIEGSEMAACAKVCRRSAELCWEMSQGGAGKIPLGQSTEKFFGIGP